MKPISKFHKMSALLGASLLIVTACVPDSLTRGGGAQPASTERGNDNSAASNANEAGALTTPRLNSSAQPAAASAAGSTLASPLPTPTTPVRNEFEFTGAVEVMASDMWVVGGRAVAVTTATEIKPGLEIGTLAKVHAVRQADGSLWAREIEPADDDDNGNSNSNDNGNSNDDNGNGNSNDDNENDDDGNGNSNDDNENDDNGNGNSNDDNENDDDGNSNDANENDEDGNSNDANENDDDDEDGNSNDANDNDDGNSNDANDNGNVNDDNGNDD